MNLKIFSENDLFSPYLLPVTSEDIHIWFLPSDGIKRLKELFPYLPKEEQKRALKYTFEPARLAYLTGHTALRIILGKYLDCNGSCLNIRTNIHGKPFLDYSAAFPKISKGMPHIEFNISHSGEYVALAFSLDFPIGIDIEKISLSANVINIVKRFFHPDEAILFSDLDKKEQINLFFRYWTIREAFLKGIGTGFAISPDSFCIQPADTENSLYVISKSAEDYSSWKIQAVQPPCGYLCSVAYYR